MDGNDGIQVTTDKRLWWLVALMALCYGVGELSHFMVGITSRAMSQELQYGDQSCLINNTDTGNVTCSDYTTEEACNSTDEGVCQWDYNGLGIEYQILAGPSFILAYTIGGLLLGALADRYNRVVILSISTLAFSAFTVIMGTAQEVWQLIVLRIGVAFGEAACQVVPASLVSTMFPQSFHGAALGIVNWGIYFGYGLSYVVGNYVSSLNILGQGWRWCYYLSGMPGFLVAFLLLASTSDPRKRSQNSSKDESAMETKSFTDQNESQEDKPLQQKRPSFWRNLRQFFQPTILFLCLAACVRHTAGFSWAYNTQLYYDTYYPGYDVGLWLFGVSIVGGSLGILIGGIVSDKIVKKIGLQARTWVLAASQLLAAPFAVGVLLAPPPYTFLCLLVAYLFAEMWFGVLFAILVEVIPAEICSFTVAIFLFIMNNVGGNLPVIVDPLRQLMGYREVLLLVYPGFYLLSAILFAVSGCTLRRKEASLEINTE